MMTLDPMTIFFALVAIFVCWRLWALLGTDSSGPLQAIRPLAHVDVREEPVTPPPIWQGLAMPDTPLAQGLEDIAKKDPSFNAHQFLDGARKAYDMIVTAFAAGDADLLKSLLNAETFAAFLHEIEARKALGHTQKVALISFDRCDMLEAGIRQNDAFVTVKFVTKMISVTYDSAEKIVSGSASDAADHIDIWVFTRPLRSRNPNWLLAETQSPQ